MYLITYLQTYHQYAVSSKLALSNCLILPPSYPQTCTNINQTLFSGSKRMPFCTTDCHTRCQGKYIVWFKSITLLFTQLSVKVYIPYTSLQSCRPIRALNWSIIALWNFVLIKRSKCCIQFSKTIPRISITLIALDTELGKAYNWKILLFKKSWNMNQKLHRNIIYRCSLRLSLLLIQNQCPKLPPIQLSVYAICMGVGGKGGCSWLCLKLLTVKYNLQCKKPYFSGIFKPAISNKKTHWLMYLIYIIFPVSIFSRTC